MELSPILKEFITQISDGKIEIYNEASVQYELAILLRQKLESRYKVRLEKNISDFGLKGFEKKEMDITLESASGEKHCIELKYPTNGQYPEQMFSACKDIKFLEQLTSTGFDECYFVMFAKDKPFFEGKDKTGIYHFFRVEHKIRGNIQKPTGTKGKELRLTGTYAFHWEKIVGDLHYFVVTVKP